MNFNIFRNFQTHMDYEGQRLAEKLFHIIILSFGLTGFLWGYYIQQFGATVIILIAGFLVSCMITEANSSDELNAITSESGWIRLMCEAGESRLITVVLPPWPCFRRHPLVWQKPRPEKQTQEPKREERGGKRKQKAN